MCNFDDEKLNKIIIELDYTIVVKTHPKLEKFLKDNFKIPNNDLNDIIAFIAYDEDLKNIIYTIPDVIASEFPHYNLDLSFLEKEFDDDDTQLRITVNTKYNDKTS